MSQAYRELLGSDTFGASYPFINNSTRSNRGNNSGPTEPTAPESYMWWADTTTGILKQRTGANDGWTTIGPMGSEGFGLLSRAGGVMTGPVDMGANTITNLALGTGAAAARQQELDLKAPLAGPAFTGDAQLDTDPAGSNSLIRRSWAEGRYVGIAGATMTGKLNLSGNADANLEAVPRQQLQDYVAFNTTSGHRHTGTDARKVLATNLDAAGSISAQMIQSTGSGNAPSWSKIFGINLGFPFGRVALLGGIESAGSGNWTSARVTTGNYEITFSPGILPANPIMIATSNDPAQHNQICTCFKISSDVMLVKVKTTSGDAANGEFSFVVFL